MPLDFYIVDRVLFSRVCPSTFINLKEICFQAFAGRLLYKVGGGHSLTKHMGGLLEGLSQNPQNIYPKIAVFKNAKIIPPKYS